jgi:NADH:ubiquinone oxidoreductase subunit C
MTNEELKQYFTDHFPGVSFPEIACKTLNIECPGEKVHEYAQKLKSDDKLHLDYLFCQTAIDWPEFLEVIYHLRSTDLKHEIVMRVKTDGREKPEVDTVCDIWRTAEFHEREVFDLFGVVFKNHPDLRRILLEDDRIGHPMRKDYVDEINIVEL